MITQSLNGIWQMRDAQGVQTKGEVPGSVFSFLLQAGQLEDPYDRDNELSALALMDQDFVFSTDFDVDGGVLSSMHQILSFEGIDTLSKVYLNGELLGKTDNMHRSYTFDVKELLRERGNHLEVQIQSPTRYIKAEDQRHHLGGSIEAMLGFSHLRKAHCMFGWDWGPRLPDAGIWKAVSLIGWNEDLVTEILIRQEHFLSNGTALKDDLTDINLRRKQAMEARTGKIRVAVTVSVKGQDGDLQEAEVRLQAPDGTVASLRSGEPMEIKEPQLWWPNGLGAQPLYTIVVTTPEGEEVRKKIGLRTLTMRRRKDHWGESFAAEVNGQTFFSMGADYIPEDNILSRCTKERTKRLIDDCVRSHFNAIRVWGGGIYPADYFYDLCDEAGLVVWQDMMFACANYCLDEKQYGGETFAENIAEEIRQNVRRIRHHASLGLWSGNNEMEDFVLKGEYEGTEETKRDYLIQNETLTPGILKEEAPDTFYWPSSPSSGGNLDFPQDPNRGDVHYWEVWHGGVPFTEFRKYEFRYLSEFGFQSFPHLATIRTFTEPEDRNVFSYVMEMHQRNAAANGKIMQYLAQTYRYPTDFETTIYASQLLQADAIRYGVEHFRRNRNEDHCMGAVYWQLDDIWPVTSWASIDYFGRWKALQYAAKRFFQPVMISCEEHSMVSEGRTLITDPTRPKVQNTARLCVTNETWETVTGMVQWSIRDAQGEVCGTQGAMETEITVEPFSSYWLRELDMEKELPEFDVRRHHLTYRFLVKGQQVSSGSVLFCPPKHYEFANPQLTAVISEDGKSVQVSARAYAKAVELFDEEGKVRFSDNDFDMEPGTVTVQVEEGCAEHLRVRSVYDIH